MRSPSTRCRAVVLACVIAIGVALCGCGGDDEPAASDPPTTTAPSTQPSSTLSPEAEDERALRQLAEDWFETRRDILNEGRDLILAEEFLVDEYLIFFQGKVTDIRDAGHSIRDDPMERTHQETISIDLAPETAQLVECLVDGDHLLDSDGSVLDDKVASYLVRTTARRTPEGWRFSEQTSLREEVGSDQCDFS